MLLNFLFSQWNKMLQNTKKSWWKQDQGILVIVIGVDEYVQRLKMSICGEGQPETKMASIFTQWN